MRAQWTRGSVRVWSVLAAVVLVGATFVGVLVGAGGVRATTVTPIGPGFDTYAADRFVAGYLARTGLPGASVVVVHGGRVVHFGGYGSDANGRPVTVDTPMPIASLSKSVTAFAVMRLVEAGRLRLDRPVVDYLPELRMRDPRAGRITVAQLLNQTSGMADTTHPAMHVPTAGSLREAVAQLSDVELATEPGISWHYHNPNYQVAARLVEVVSGEQFNEHLRRHVFGPIGMAASYGTTSSGELVDITAGHVDAWGFPLAVREPRWFLAGSGGVVSTARDLGQWLMLQTATERLDVISAAGVRTMQTPSDPRGRYGFGWGTSGPVDDRRVGHSGALFTFTAYQVVLPQSGYGVAVLANRGYTVGPNDAEAIGRGLIDIARGHPATVAVPWWRVADAALAVATLAVAAAAVVGLIGVPPLGGKDGTGRGGRGPRLGWGGRARRSPRWSVRPARRRTFGLARGLPLGLTLATLGLLGLVALPSVGGALSGHRDITLTQLAYVTPATVTLFVVSTVLGLVMAAHAVVLRVAVRPGRSDSTGTK